MTRTDYKRFVPLMSVVKASIMDVYGDLNRLQEYHLHFAGRAVKDLQRQILKSFPRYALLPVNQNTFTATLPTDFGQETFVGIVDAKGVKMPLISNHNLALRTQLESIDPKEKCAACNQPLSVCEDLRLSETINLIEINGNTYEEKVIKKLYPNGDYFLETTTPFLNIMPATVEENRGVGFVTIDDIGEVGDTITITIDDQIYGTITLADYTRQVTDTTPTILAAAIAELINDNEWGYIADASASPTISITAREGIGAAINGGSKLQVVGTSAPLAITVETTARTATITWDAVTNPDATDDYYVEIYEGVDSIFADYRTSPFTYTLLTPQTEYSVKVTPSNSTGGLLTPSSGYIAFSTEIEIPLELVITPTDTTVTVTWDAALDTEYKVELLLSGTPVETLYQTSPYDAVALDPDTTYTIRVTPVDTEHNETYPSSGLIDFTTNP